MTQTAEPLARRYSPRGLRGSVGGCDPDDLASSRACLIDLFQQSISSGARFRFVSLFACFLCPGCKAILKGELLPAMTFGTDGNPMPEEIFEASGCLLVPPIGGAVDCLAHRFRAAKLRGPPMAKADGCLSCTLQRIDHSAMFFRFIGGHVVKFIFREGWNGSNDKFVAIKTPSY
jgi:hypothetical protein